MAPGLLLFLVFGVIPALAVFAMSFTDISGIPNVPWTWVGWKNYQRFFFSAEASANVDVIVRTVVFCLAVTVVQNVLALGVALVVNKRRRFTNLVRAIVFLPVVLGVTVIGLTWTLFFNPTGGPAASLLERFGLSSAFFGDSVLAFPLIIGVSIWSALGFSMLIFLAGLQGVPQDLYEQARVDGAGRWHQFTAVTVPMLAPAITANVLIAIIGSLQTYQLIYILTGDRATTSVLAMRIFTTGFGNSEQGYASGIAVVQFLLVGVIAITALFFLRRRETQL